MDKDGARARLAPGSGHIDSAGNPDENTRMHHNHRTAHAIAVAAFLLHAAPAACRTPGPARARFATSAIAARCSSTALFPRRQGREACRFTARSRPAERNIEPDRPWESGWALRQRAQGRRHLPPVVQVQSSNLPTPLEGRHPLGKAALGPGRVPGRRDNNMVIGFGAAAAPLTAGTAPGVRRPERPRRTAVPLITRQSDPGTTRTCSPRPTAFTVPSRKRTHPSITR